MCIRDRLYADGQFVHDLVRLRVDFQDAVLVRPAVHIDVLAVLYHLFGGTRFQTQMVLTAEYIQIPPSNTKGRSLRLHWRNERPCLMWVVYKNICEMSIVSLHFHPFYGIRNRYAIHFMQFAATSKRRSAVSS